MNRQLTNTTEVNTRRYTLECILVQLLLDVIHTYLCVDDVRYTHIYTHT